MAAAATLVTVGGAPCSNEPLLFVSKLLPPPPVPAAGAQPLNFDSAPSLTSGDDVVEICNVLLLLVGCCIT